MEMISTTTSMIMQTRAQFCISLVSIWKLLHVFHYAYLESAHKRVINIVLEQLVTDVVVASPSPHVLLVAVVLCVLQDDNAGNPDSHAEGEPADGEERVVDAHLLSAFVTSTDVADEDEDADEQGQAGGAKSQALGDNVGVLCPCREAVLRCQVLGGVEDGESGCQHGEHNQAAAEVDSTQRKLGHSHSCFDFLDSRLAACPS